MKIHHDTITSTQEAHLHRIHSFTRS